MEGGGAEPVAASSLFVSGNCFLADCERGSITIGESFAVVAVEGRAVLPAVTRDDATLAAGRADPLHEEDDKSVDDEREENEEGGAREEERAPTETGAEGDETGFVEDNDGGGQFTEGEDDDMEERHD